MHGITRRLAGATVLVVLASPGLAQPPDDARGRGPMARPLAWTGLVVLTANGGGALTQAFSDTVVFPAGVTGTYDPARLSTATADEAARFTSAYRFETGTVFDLSGGVRLWRNLGVGAGVSLVRQAATADVEATAPHPFFYARDRQLSGTRTPLAREERAVHVQALWVLPVGAGFTVTVFGGPTAITVTQTLVTDVRLTQSYPFDTAVFAGATTEAASASAVGAHVGGDLAYYFSRAVGVGWLTRYSRATVDLGGPNGPVRLQVGGLSTTAGLRVRF